MTTVSLPGYRCGQCGHQWVAQARNGAKQEPVRCPKCMTRRWRESAKAKPAD